MVGGTYRKLHFCRMKNYKKYHTVGQVPKFNIKIVERTKIGSPNTQLHDR